MHLYLRGWNFCVAFFGFAAFLSAAGLLGPITPPLERALTLLFLLSAAIAAIIEMRPTRWAGVLMLAPALLIPLSKYSNDQGHMVQVCAVVGVLFIVVHTGRDNKVSDYAARTLNAILLATFVLILVRHAGWAWAWVSDTSLLLSRLAGWMSGEPLRLGPSSSGFWLLLLYLGFGLPVGKWPSLNGKTIVRTILYAGSGLLVYLIVLSATPVTEALLARLVSGLLSSPHYYDRIDPTAVPGILVPAATLLFLSLLFVPAHWMLRKAVTSVPSRAPRWTHAVALTAAMLGFLLITLPRPQAFTPGLTIAFHDQGLDWSRPQSGRYGLIQVGMFGALRDYLQGWGYRIRSIKGNIDAEKLQGVDALVIINPRQIYDKHDHEAIWEYVNNGGGLLVMGDHTNIYGILPGLNSLLEPTGIRFAFDSAFPVRKHWRFCQEYRPHPITMGLHDHRDTGIGTGASLILDNPAAKPLILGRYAFSDLGNRANTGKGAMLGDYRYQIGEQLNDVVLVANAEYGAGRVLVFGDTSSFQSLLLAYNHEFVEQVFRYIGAGSAPARLALFGGWLLLLAGVYMALRRTPHTARAPAWLIVGLLVGETVAAFIRTPPPVELGPQVKQAYFDTKHANGVAFEFFSDGSIGGALAGIYRAGYLPVTYRWRDLDTLASPDMAVFIAPRKVPGADTKKALGKMLAQGGTLFVASGRPAGTAVNQLLEPCGLAMGNKPLGPVEYGQREAKLEFVDAWPVYAKDGIELTPVVNWHREVIVGTTQVGQGTCIAMGDHRFLEDENMEGEYDFQRANVEFYETLLAAPGKTR